MVPPRRGMNSTSDFTGSSDSSLATKSCASHAVSPPKRVLTKIFPRNLAQGPRLIQSSCPRVWHHFSLLVLTCALCSLGCRDSLIFAETKGFKHFDSYDSAEAASPGKCGRCGASHRSQLRCPRRHQSPTRISRCPDTS